MKTRWISLLLCFVMLLSVGLTSCSKEQSKSDIIEPASQNALTLTMWVVAEEKPSADAYARISAALNSITKSKFKVQLVLRYFTEDEYRTELEKAITAFEANKQSSGSQGAVDPEQESVSDEYVTNDAGLSVIKYPEVLQNQVDIIYISGEDMYLDFVNKEWLADLKAELASTAKKIKEYVSPTLLSAVQTASGQTYAIPNNRPIGQYNYMLINKELMKTYAQDAYVKTDMIDGLFSENLYPFLNLVHMMDENDEIIPIDYTYEDCLNLLAHYWNISSDDYKISALKQFSVFGYYYENIEDLSRGSVMLGYESLFEDEAFVEDYLKLNEFRFKDYLRRENETRTKAAVKFMNGDATVMSKKDAEGVICYTDENGEEYYPIIVGYPTATTEDIYGNMFGVCSMARDVSRSMEIITYLNTNPDFRNLLQYGVEGVDYKIIKDDEGNFLQIDTSETNTGYKMNIWATGNTFIAYPDTEAGLDIHVWENGKVQNRDSLVDPLLGFDFKSATAEEELGVTIASSGYNTALTTGHSKALLSQNATLAQWLTDCDAAGKGVYVLQAKKAESSYTTFQYYFYNNNVSGKVKPTLSATPITEVNSKGKEVTIGVDFALNYAPATGAPDTAGYELTCLTIQVKKSMADQVSMKVTKDDADLEASVKEISEVITFDFYNTANYSIEVYADLTKAEIRKNLTLMNWLKSKAQTGNSTGAATHMLKYKDGNDYVFVVYRNGIKCLNVMTLAPKGDPNNLILDMNIQESEEVGLGAGKPSYVMYLIRVKTASDAVNVDCVQTLNGQRKAFTSTPTEDVKIDYERLGQMDTELVKFAERLNVAVIALLDACYAKGMAAIEVATDKDAAIEQAIADYNALVNDLSKLLATDVDSLPGFTAENYPALYGSIDLLDAVKVDSFNTFLKYMKDATSYEIIEEPKNAQTGADAVLSTPDGNEAYVYLTSPFGIYYQWLKSSKFLPEEK